jgi:hypothetical protein
MGNKTGDFITSKCLGLVERLLSDSVHQGLEGP